MKTVKIYKLASQLSGLYKTLYKDTMPFHNKNTDEYRDKAWGIMKDIEQELEREFERRDTYGREE